MRLFYNIPMLLPKIIRVGDYHEFDTIKDHLRMVGIKGIRIKEIGFDGDHIGVVYVAGDLEKVMKMSMVKQILARNKKYNT